MKYQMRILQGLKLAAVLAVALSQSFSPAPSGAGLVFSAGLPALVCFSHIFGVLPPSMCCAFDVTPISSSGQNVIQIS